MKWILIHDSPPRRGLLRYALALLAPVRMGLVTFAVSVSLVWWYSPTPTVFRVVAVGKVEGPEVLTVRPVMERKH